MPQTFIKDPDAVKDYEIDWTAWLDGDTIATSLWLTDAPSVGIGTKTASDTTTTVWISGGILGTTVEVTNRITTAGGRTEDRTLTFTILEQ